MSEVKYGWSTSKDAERYQGPVESVESAIWVAIQEAGTDGPPDLVYVGKVERPEINGLWFTSGLIDSVYEWLDEEVGEASENFEATPELKVRLAEAIEGVFSGVDFKCWSISDPVAYSKESQEYQRALSRMSA